MIEATPELRAHLALVRNLVRVNLYTFVLTDGTTLRWTDGDVDVTAGGHVFSCSGPSIERESIKLTRGIEVGTLSVTLHADESVRVSGGQALIPFIVKGGFDDANVQLEVAFLDAATSAVIGTIVRMVGTVGQIDDGDGFSVPLQVVSRSNLLNVNMPAALFQRPCLNTLFNTGCGLNRADWAVAGVVTGVPASSRSFATNLTQPSGWFSLGTIVIGGVRRTVRSQDGAGNLVLSGALPFVPSAGATFTAYPGCDRQQSTCEEKFHNNVGSGRNRFRGQPYIPIAETAV